MTKTYMNKVERFVVQNRQQLDTEEVPDTVWEKIQLPVAKKQTQKKALLQPLYKWSIAAVSAGVIFSGIYLFTQKPNHQQQQSNNNIENSISANTEKPTNNNDGDSSTTEEIKSIAPTHAPKVEEIYKTIVAKQTELKTVASINPELYRQFASDLAILDSSYRMLKLQANSSPNRDVIIKAMIQNLELQAELLSRQLQIIHQFKNSKNESHETNNNRNI